MAFQNPSDMVEEDAADLQFPKDEIDDIIEVVPNETTERKIEYYKPKNFFIKIENFNEKQLYCNICKNILSEPYINCVECSNNFLICLNCFCRGSENRFHKSNHSYKVIRDDNIEIFPCDMKWLAKEEKKLLDLLLIHGYGNWEGIAKEMKTKTPDQCRQHYLSNYFGGIFEKTIGLTKEPYVREVVPYLYKMTSIDPPRYDIDNVNFKRMAGYRCARSDFDIPYDPSAESTVSNLLLLNGNDECKEIFDVMNCAVFQAYNNRLMERQRRAAIIKEHGLLMGSRTLSWISKHSDALGFANAEGRSTGRFVAFMQLMPAITFDALVEALQYATDLKKYIYRLYDLRKNGITTFYGGQFYHKLKAKRLTKVRNKKAVQYENITDWRNLMTNLNQAGQHMQYLSNSNMLYGVLRRKTTPLEIMGLPGYEKLNEDEKNLCSSTRLSPLAYLDYKNILISENTKCGFLRLAEARRLLKIDVNKTRQLYDFLLKFGFINKPLM